MGGGATDLGDFVEVGSFTLLADAQLIESVLRAEGIEVHLRGEAGVSALPHMSNAIGGVSAYVPARDAERAREILASQGGEPASSEDAAALDGDDAGPSPRDAAARRAFLAAGLGLVFLPVVLHVISIWQLAAFVRIGGPASKSARRRAIAAAIVDAVVIVAAVAFVVVSRRR